MKLYHGTNMLDLDRLIPSYGRFGTAVYASRDRDYAKRYGKELVEIEYEEDIRKIYYSDLIRFDPSLNIDEEEGLTNLKRFILDSAVEIVYNDGESEIAIYDSVDSIKYISTAEEVDLNRLACDILVVERKTDINDLDRYQRRL